MTRYKSKRISLQLFLDNNLHAITEPELLSICQRLWDYEEIRMDAIIQKLKDRRSLLLVEVSMIDNQLRTLEDVAKRPAPQPITYRFRCVCGQQFGNSASELKRFEDHRFIVHPGEAPKPPIKLSQPQTPRRTPPKTAATISPDDIA